MLGPVIEQIANEAPAGVKICKCDVDATPALAMEFQVMSIPMLVVIKDGKHCLLYTSGGHPHHR